ncbi:glycosyltransferase family 2 protein [Polynucleobacter sp. 73C-SIWE]|uniref:glycosyltransferase family 2 protein n=1 Tax=Polynucleobacter sp. 73C-SIWE TaxID=2689098 RepID=UPI001C0B90F8|nr:glycosyltransferase family 2 protein [Polynucleobacter sp. 73C-SIWE]MBU3580228.1 glycosyltransferase family 2 protein [Polynucleobacter sp. 73C-SIWE]
MRTVICHFYNESYLLPWWLNHHKNIFDHGIMINHRSTDSSVDIIKKITPNWDIVETRLSEFDAYMTDLEVMNYEEQVTGFKIALNVTEFLMPTLPLEQIEHAIQKLGRVGCAASGMICVDNNISITPNYDSPLQTQKYFGYDDNLIIDQRSRMLLGQSPYPYRNRFYHSHKVGMYQPGRHLSYHHDANFRVNELMIFHYGYAPWNESFLARKIQIKDKVSKGDISRNWGLQHLKGYEELNSDFEKQKILSIDLNTHPFAGQALKHLR